ncbi:MAG: sulfur oxidation c-type cytochrome SoxA [Sulfurospirillaceae bacterium]|nr:sulfur oxidation c-type cytochrome SoxA [Sulfurospirillaceae bacterium]
MLNKLIKIAAIFMISSTIVFAASFNAQAEKDRIAFVNYFLKKFENPVANQAKYFPNVSKKELETDYIYPLKFQDFQDGPMSWYKPAREQFAEINAFPPYEIPLDDGEALFKKPFANGKTYSSCFPDPAIKQNYPYYDTKRDEIVTIGMAVNECRVKNGEKPLKYGKGDLAKVVAYIAYKSRGKKINIKIPNEKAAQAYEAGKKLFYKQRGYLSISCNECHVLSSGKRIRAEALSPALGSTTEMPVYRLKWGGLGTLQRRLAGCVKDTGSEQPKLQSKPLKELEYFLTYMSNGMKLYGPDTRK